MYSEPFDIPAPNELVLISTFEGYEVFRSGCCWQFGQGRMFYFRPGHETNHSLLNPVVGLILRNAARWASGRA
jgi:trehalose utilization protein